MPDRKAIIRGLKELQAWLKHLQTVGFHGDIPEYRERELTVSDALALLREQEAVSTIVEPLNDTRYIFCGACKAMLAQNKPKGYKYCPWCGKKVKWRA